MLRALRRVALGIMVLLVGGLVGFPTLAQAAGVQADFNADGFDDLAIGAPQEGLSGATNAGSVNVIYGSGSGLTATGDQVWHQDSPGITGKPETNDLFGLSLTAGDFDDDGADDLAIGAALEDLGGARDAGAVHVLYGSGSGLTATGSQLWHQDTPGVAGGTEESDRFGDALAAGDFDGDGADDLAVGASGEDVEGASAAGAVNVIYGSGSGLTATGDQLWHQDSPGISSSAEDGETFGGSLAADTFDSDGSDDLVVGVPWEDTTGINRAGALNVIYGSGSGLTATGDQFWHQASPGIAGSPEGADFFADELATGDFDDDGDGDLAVGVPEEDLGGAIDAGAVHVLYGSGSGLTATGSQLWHQDTPGVAGGTEQLDLFGLSLTAGDFDDDGADDVAVGAPGEDLGGATYAGVVHVLYSSGSGLAATGSQLWHQDTPGVADEAEPHDRFGSSLTVGDFFGDGADDLASGARGEDVEGALGAGAVNVIYGIGSGLTATGNQFWHQDTPGILGDAEKGDTFGALPGSG